jgi:lipopolysaccharide/colanic/teichoic acid biosynthesis glycosyltransferase
MKISNIIKRLLDILLSFFIFIFSIPVLILTSFALLILEGRPIFYTSKRLCTPTKSIAIIKFRTMVRDAISEKYRLNERFMQNGFLNIPLTCEVYTPIGRLLERTQIVEILQIINIIMGDMSFVGNRPLPKSNIELLKQFPRWEDRFNSPAGITGISQIAGKYDIQPEQRLYLERMYSSIYQNANGNILLCDITIIWHTCALLLSGKYLGYDKSLALLMRCGAR